MKIVFLTGAGISSESGLPTYRDLIDGLWQNYNLEDVATKEAIYKNPELVLKFHNLLYEKVKSVEPNDAHKQIALLSKKHDVFVFTQNVDDLHERGGMSCIRVYHLHGDITKSKSIIDSNLKYNVKEPIKMGDKCDYGFQLRYDTVLFGEMPYHLETAFRILNECDLFVIIGTSLNVYPVNLLPNYAKCKKYIIDPNADSIEIDDINIIKETACKGIYTLIDKEKL